MIYSESLPLLEPLMEFFRRKLFWGCHHIALNVFKVHQNDDISRSLLDSVQSNTEPNVATMVKNGQ
jgi:hypothetical protein